jgi:hypothetical protein
VRRAREPSAAQRAPQFRNKRSVMNTTEFVNAILASRNTHADALNNAMQEIKAMDPANVRELNVEVFTAMPRLLAALPRVAALTDDIKKVVPQDLLPELQKLESLAYAVLDAQVRCMSTGKSPEQLRALGEEGDAVRRLLVIDAAALVARGLLSADRISGCTNQPGYKAVASELSVLTSVMSSVWPQIQGKCGITLEELKRGQAIAEALVAYLGSREQSPESKAEAMDVRDRAFTLIVDRWDEVRRAVSFVRWKQGDLEEIAPSLFGGRTRKAKTDDEVEQPGQPGQPAVTPAPAPNASPATPANAQPTTPQALGPNGSPFMH